MTIEARGRVFFDLSDVAINQGNPVLSNPRVMLGCHYHSFCNERLPNINVQPKFGASAQRQQWQSDQTYEIQIDMVDDFDVTWRNNLGPTGVRRSSTNAATLVMFTRPLPIHNCSLYPIKKTLESRNFTASFEILTKSNSDRQQRVLTHEPSRWSWPWIILCNQRCIKGRLDQPMWRLLR